ncbi:MAG: ATP-binding protein [Pseudomonadota bacterium]|uniref:ATP-binding protein n=1 Tax=uncultured Sphingomonas sp. TaxID=158754 RepID=UPI0030FB99D7
MKSAIFRSRFAAALPGLCVFLGVLCGSLLWQIWAEVSGKAPPLSFSLGIGVASLILVGLRYWPVVAIAAIGTTVFAEPVHPVLQNVAHGAGLTLGAVISAFLIERWRIRPSDLLDPKSVWRTLAAVVAGTFAGAVSATTVVMLVGGPGTFAAGVEDRAARFGLGLILATPLVLSWAAPPAERWTRVAWFNFVALMVLCAAVAAAINFGSGTASFAWVMFPLIIAALRFHLRGAATSMVLVAVITLWAAGQNSFQAVGELASGQVRLAQLLVAVTAATMFVLAATADKRREQERARDAEQRYRAIFEQAGVGVAVLSADGEYLAANERYLEIAGYGRDELLGSHYTAILDDTEASASRNVLAQLSGGTPPIISRDLNIRTMGGEKRWIRATSSKIVGAAGAVDQVVTVVEDISERVKAEVALSESEKRFRLAQQYAGVGVFDINLTEESALHSPESAALFGVPWHPGAYRLSEFVDRIGQSQLHEMRAKLFRSAVDEAPFEMSLRVSMPDRRIRWIRLHGRYDPYEERPRLLGLVIDITSDVEAKAQLREANEKFLRVTRLSAMGAMASTLAHELNQPLSAITNYVEAGRYKLCDAEAVDGKLLAILDSARDQALRAGEIIRKMRAFAVSGEVVFERVSLGPVLAAACAGVQQLKMADDVTLICHPVRPDLLVVGDPVQLEQVMSNLVRNAVEATEGVARREIVVSTDIRQRDVLITVSDNGCGLPQGMLENLFAPFRTSKSNGAGLGLGLPICRTIVEAHGGKLWAENNPQGGATFSLVLLLEEGWAHLGKGEIASEPYGQRDDRAA